MSKLKSLPNMYFLLAAYKQFTGEQNPRRNSWIKRYKDTISNSKNVIFIRALEKFVESVDIYLDMSTNEPAMKQAYSYYLKAVAALDNLYDLADSPKYINALYTKANRMQLSNEEGQKSLIELHKKAMKLVAEAEQKDLDLEPEVETVQMDAPETKNVGQKSLSNLFRVCSEVQDYLQRFVTDSDTPTNFELIYNTTLEDLFPDNQFDHSNIPFDGFQYSISLYDLQELSRLKTDHFPAMDALANIFESVEVDEHDTYIQLNVFHSPEFAANAVVSVWVDEGDRWIIPAHDLKPTNLLPIEEVASGGELLVVLFSGLYDYAASILRGNKTNFLKNCIM